MPNVPRPADDYLMDYLKGLDRRIGAVATQQNWGITDGNGHLRILCGLQNDGTYGLRIFDDDNNARVKLGDLGNGDYGLAVLDVIDGSYPIVNAVQEQPSTGTLDTASTTWADLGGPSLTVEIGSAGKALVMASSIIGLDLQTGTQEGKVGIEVDGVFSTELLSVSTPGAAVQLTSSNNTMVPMTQGAHTIKSVFESVFGQTIHFTNTSLVVIPY